MSAGQGPQEQRVNIRLRHSVIDDGETPVVYSNYVQASMSPVDVTVHLGWYSTPTFDQADPPPTDSTVDVPVRSLTKVSLPIPVARALQQVLANQLGLWEANFGGKSQAPAGPPDGQEPSTEASKP